MIKPILLVEDDPRDLELTLVALERSQLANEVVVLRDGAQALDYLRREGEHAGRDSGNTAVVLLDLNCPRSMAWKCSKRCAPTRRCAASRW